jgi:hypothetical protein
MRSRRDTTFRKADVMRAIRAAQAVGISKPRIEIDRHGTIMIIPGEPPKDNGAAAPDTPESVPTWARTERDAD